MGENTERVIVKAIKPYKDVQLNRAVRVGDVLQLTQERALELINRKLVDIILINQLYKFNKKINGKAKNG